MVKIVYCISNLPHLSNEEFHRYCDHSRTAFFIAEEHHVI